MKRKPKLVKLINPRGRVVEVKESEVPKMIERGFLAPPGHGGEYNPVFDRHKQTMPKNELVEVVKQTKRVLDVNKI